METVSATEAKNQLGRVMDMAQKQPVLIEKNGRPSVVMMSAEAYDGKTKQERKKDFIKLCHELAEEAKRNGMTEEILTSILADED